jgi:hypothetical protein
MDPNISTSLNPFIYSTPDQIEDPVQALNLFVDVFKDFYLIESPGNTFINGARGSGKSMMFRIMRPDCQKQKLQTTLQGLNYYAIYIPIKDTSLNIQELEFLTDKHGENIFNEHLMATYFSIGIFKCLSKESYEDNETYTKEIRAFYNNFFIKTLRIIGYDIPVNPINTEDDIEVFSFIVDILEDVLQSFSTYIQRLSLGAENLVYNGPLCLYRNFLFPMIKEIQKLSFLPKEKPLYLLVDDADLLNYAQTKILNSWVSFRTTSIVCFKITTQLNYKTYYTTSINRIDSPHDYHEINFSDIYTSNLKGRYRENIKDMIEKRLKYIADITTTAEVFFSE